MKTTSLPGRISLKLLNKLTFLKEFEVKIVICQFRFHSGIAFQRIPQAYSEPCQTSKMEQPLTISAKSSILDV